MNNIIFTVKILKEYSKAYQDMVNEARQEFIDYFGAKHAVYNKESPILSLSCDITAEDINYLRGLINSKIELIILKKEGDNFVLHNW